MYLSYFLKRKRLRIPRTKFKHYQTGNHIFNVFLRYRVQKIKIRLLNKLTFLLSNKVLLKNEINKT